MLKINGNVVSRIVVGNKNVQEIIYNNMMLFQATKSCFGNGSWDNDKPWDNDDAWDNG